MPTLVADAHLRRLRVPDEGAQGRRDRARHRLPRRRPGDDHLPRALPPAGPEHRPEEPRPDEADRRADHARPAVQRRRRDVGPAAAENADRRADRGRGSATRSAAPAARSSPATATSPTRRSPSRPAMAPLHPIQVIARAYGIPPNRTDASDLSAMRRSAAVIGPQREILIDLPLVKRSPAQPRFEPLPPGGRRSAAVQQARRGARRRDAKELVWRELGACRGLDPGIFYPDDDDEALDAKAVCAQCNVRVACLEYALAGPREAGRVGWCHRARAPAHHPPAPSHRLTRRRGPCRPSRPVVP